MGTWIAEDSAHALAQAYKNADMHAGNDKQSEPERQPTEQIDWEKHRQFMRGLG